MYDEKLKQEEVDADTLFGNGRSGGRSTARGRSRSGGRAAGGRMGKSTTQQIVLIRGIYKIRTELSVDALFIVL